MNRSLSAASSALVAPLCVLALVALSSESARAQIQLERAEFDVQARYRVAITDAPSRGSADAPITIVEFSDFACQFCRRARVTVDLLERLYPGDIRLVFRINPLDPEDGTLASEASMAAHEQGYFWAMHDRIFAAGGAVTRTQLEAFALELGLDVGRFRQALDSQRFRPYVDRQVTRNTALGVRSTPMFFVNGRVIKGSQPLSVFVELIEAELSAARTLIAGGVPAAGVYAAHMADAKERADGAAGTGKNPRFELDDDSRYRADYRPPGHALGPPGALVEIVAFTDFQCRFCKELVPSLRALRANYPDDVRIVFRHQPLDFHPDAYLASEAAVAAAAQGRFWAMHDRIFEHPRRMKRTDLEAHARAVGLDMDRFLADFDAGRYREVVLNDLAIGGALGIRGTPTLLINGTPLRGIVSYDVLVARYVEPRLEEARAMVLAGSARADVVPAIMARAERYPSDDTWSEEPTVAPAMEPNGAAAPVVEPVNSRASSEARGVSPLRDLYITCSARDAARARRWFARVRDRGQREMAREYCRAYGIELTE